ncbi:MAG: DUF523 domain-containing protein [Desulfobulbaceae bacterium]|nr:DUF523 domain-containing protein [Desulfobulbaceae bacterium]HIJ79924.1 DUF523 domain-containing protein [Deltaproteobacteria bacterium]
MTSPIKIGISACLIGQPVRYDGEDQRNAMILDTLGRHAQLVPVCPETECGLGVPRETMHLVEEQGVIRLLTTESGLEHTEKLLAWSRDKISELKKKNLAGFILKSRSPSCGVRSTKIFDDKGGQTATGPGLFARCLQQAFPELPLAEEEELRDHTFYTNFLNKLGIRTTAE